MHRRTWTLAALLLIPSCSNDFAPYSQLDRLRLMGVSASPPNPSAGETCQLSALTFAPDDRPIALRWSFCPVVVDAKTGYSCPLTETASRDILGASVPFDLGTASTTSFTHLFAADVLAAVCRYGIDGDGLSTTVNCDQGYPVSILLDVATADDALRAAFTVFLPASSTPDQNANPTVLQLALAGQELAEEPIAVVLAEGQAVDLTARLSLDASEMRPIPPAEGGAGQRRERLTLSWFADAGRMDQDRTVYIDGETTMEAATRNRWTPPRRTDPSTQTLVRFAVVVRDDRGGVGWLTRQLHLEVRP